ncbi:alkaline phosphatase family protein [Mesorhizobium sp. WSM4310]|uniref:alkaline phosphatase family protein n=1 Tax=Mesorhizobium sp. WSM4310 TaxID=2589883 RepID=UPI00163DA87B|nr:alkaline phosphatase family protein [Mesorhizobium sp. WSM4310]
MLAVLAAIMALSGGLQAVASSAKPPKYDHVVVVIMENHSFEQISLARRAAPYLNRLAKGGALFEQSYGVAHPSQPNYLALFSGLTQGVHDDGMHSFAAPNLAARLRAHSKTFAGYVEARSPRKHNPWESFADSKGFEKPLAQFPRDYAKLPSVSFVIPNLDNDMHDGTIEAADAWLKTYLGGYAAWSKKNNSLLIVTFDEDDYHTDNHIFTVFYGFGVEPGRYSEKVDHYSVLRTIEDIESIPPLGTSVIRKVIASGWNRRQFPTFRRQMIAPE